MFEFEDHGTVWLIRPRDDAAREHAKTAFGEAPLRMGEAIACEPRYVVHTARAMIDNGFRVLVEGAELLGVDID